MAASEPRIKVFAHVAHGFGIDTWNRRYREGKLIGTTDAFAYGYHRANEMGCEVTYSTDHDYNSVQRLLRLTLRFLLGFDLMHAFSNRRHFREADVIWTHTESQYLAILFLAMVMNLRLPKMICQSVWLIDSFDRLLPTHRWLYLHLMRKADVLTFHSDLNADICRRLLKDADIRIVRFGVNGDRFYDKPNPMRIARPNIVAVGNDRHRDWATLIAQFAEKDCDVRIISTTIRYPHPLPANIVIAPVSTQDQLVAAYLDADIAIVPLKKNLHASGITAVLEAVVFSTPVVVTNTGGIDGYFTGDQVYFADIDAGSSIYNAAMEVIADPAGAVEKTAAARRRFVSSESYVAEHVRISRELLNMKP